MMWKAQGFLNEISSNWGNVISSVLQLCPGPAPLTPCPQEGGLHEPTRPLPTLETPDRIFLQFKAHQSLGQSSSGAPQCRAQHPAAHEAPAQWRAPRQEILWNHKLLKALKAKIISSHSPQWRGLSAPVGWVRSKVHYLEQSLQAHNDWIMSIYSKGKTDNHSLRIFRYVRSCINP